MRETTGEEDAAALMAVSGSAAIPISFDRRCPRAIRRDHEAVHGEARANLQKVTRLDRIPSQRVDKFAERRAELAEAALQTLSELGYARTSLREIAQNSEFSHGVLHYYFKDKADLITCCVRQYKNRCIARYDQATASAVSFDALLESFLEGLGDSIRFDGAMHRLWFDLRTQSLFESDYRAEVVDLDKNIEDMIWLIVSRLFELAGVPNNA